MLAHRLTCVRFPTSPLRYTLHTNISEEVIILRFLHVLMKILENFKHFLSSHLCRSCGEWPMRHSVEAPVKLLEAI